MRLVTLCGCSLLLAACGKVTAGGDSSVDGGPPDGATSGGSTNEGGGSSCSPAEDRLRAECDDPSVLDPTLSAQMLQQMGTAAWTSRLWDGHAHSASASVTWTFTGVTNIDGLSCLASAAEVVFVGGGPLDFGRLSGPWVPQQTTRLTLRDGFQLSTSGFDCLVGGVWPTQLFLENLPLTKIPSLQGITQLRTLLIRQAEPLDLEGLESATIVSLSIFDAQVRSVDTLSKIPTLANLGVIDTHIMEPLDLSALSLRGLFLDGSSLSTMPVVEAPQAACAEYSGLDLQVDEAIMVQSGEDACKRGWVVTLSSVGGAEYACTPAGCE